MLLCVNISLRVLPNKLVYSTSFCQQINIDHTEHKALQQIG